MKIINNYDGSSIDIINEDLRKNEAVLSLRKEKDSYSHYYNFRVENDLNKVGTVFIKNITKSAYYCPDQEHAPYIKETDKEWKRLDSEEWKIANDTLKINIQPHKVEEISLSPRYTKNELDEFISKIKNNPNIHIEEKILQQIEIGDKENPTIIVIGRQHPGETLSSFFIEGMIEEIIENKLKYHFLIYPIVNQEGVKNGNHRYFNETDYNRSWNKQDAPQEIKYIREIVKKTKPEYFIDVHNDEISSKDYVTMKSNITEIGGIQVLKPRSTIKRFIRAIIKQHKIINPRLKTAREYIQQEYNCKSILIELSMNEEYTKAKNKGKKFIIDLLKERN